MSAGKSDKELEEEFLEDPEELSNEEGSLAQELIDDPEVQITMLLDERDELKDKWMRALADGENLRKRAAKDRRDAELYGGTRLARDLLSVYDNMNRALEAIDEDMREKHKPVVEGIELTQRELLNTFEKHQIRIIRPEVGDRFDPNLHQAMFEAPVPGQKQGTIIQVMTDGFEIGDRLLRAAQVGVSSGGDAN